MVAKPGVTGNSLTAAGSLTNSKNMILIVWRICATLLSYRKQKKINYKKYKLGQKAEVVLNCNIYKTFGRMRAFKNIIIASKLQKDFFGDVYYEAM